MLCVHHKADEEEEEEEEKKEEEEEEEGAGGGQQRNNSVCKLHCCPSLPAFAAPAGEEGMAADATLGEAHHLTTNPGNTQHRPEQCSQAQAMTTALAQAMAVALAVTQALLHKHKQK